MLSGAEAKSGRAVIDAVARPAIFRNERRVFFIGTSIQVEVECNVLTERAHSFSISFINSAVDASLVAHRLATSDGAPACRKPLINP